MLNNARKKKSMSKKSFDSSNELDFNVLQSASNERLNVPVTIYRGVHPQPLKTISLRDLLLEMVSDDISKIAATSEKYLSDAQKGIEGAKKPYEEKKAQFYVFSIGKFSYRNDKNSHLFLQNKILPFFMNLKLWSFISSVSSVSFCVTN
jgi:hypothetical protein